MHRYEQDYQSTKTDVYETAGKTSKQATQIAVLAVLGLLFLGSIVLVVLTIGQIARLGLQIYDDQYHYHYDEDTFLYAIQDGQYSELPEKKNRNELEHVKADAQMLECYAVADYYEAASMYYAYETIGNAAKAADAKADMGRSERPHGRLKLLCRRN